MKGRIKKATAVLMLACLIAGILPANIVFATAQNPVTGLTITERIGTSNTYTVAFEWDALNAPSQLSANDRDDDNEYYSTYGVSRYEVQYSNVTRQTSTVTASGPTPPARSFTMQNLALDSGSIYSFKVLPYHTHVTTSGTNTVYQEVTNTSSEEALLLTDIQVDAKGSGNSITFTWDAPTYNNKQIFSRYILYYKQGGTDARDFVQGSSNTVTISVDDPNVTRASADSSRPGIPRLSYTVTDTSVIGPGYYSVAVEPCLPDTWEPIRKAATPKIEVSAGKWAPIAFSPYDGKVYGRSDAFVTLPLGITEEGKDFLKLFWASLSSLGTVNSIYVYSSTDYEKLNNELNSGSPSMSPISMLFSGTATSVIIDKPTSGVTFYALLINVAGKQPMRTEIVSYDSSKVNIRPTRPDIHDPVTATNDKKGMVVTWDAFVRDAVNSTDTLTTIGSGSKTFSVDTNVYYDVWITDDMNNFTIDGLTPIATFTPQTIGAPILHLRDAEKPEEGTVPAYQKTFTQYLYNFGEIADIQPNKLYYIKITAKKLSAFELADGESYLYSEPAYATVYFPLTGDISSPPMISRPPLKIREENGSQVITDSSIDIEWRETWWEVYDENTGHWYTKIAKIGDELYFGAEADGKDEYLVDIITAGSMSEVRTLLGIDDSVPVRNMNIKDCSYDVKVMLFDEFLAAAGASAGYSAYLEQLIDEGTQDGWTAISPQKDGERLYATIPNLLPNTAYAILLRPYRVLQPEGNRIGYPNYVSGTTIPSPVTTDRIPTVPKLEGVSNTDMTVTLRWNYIEGYKYELIYSENSYQDIESASGNTIQISMEEIDENAKIVTEDGQTYMYYTVTGLFPETGYYFWIRSLGTKPDGGYNYSKWSNSVYMITDLLATPDPPRGLGYAATEHVKIINDSNGTEYKVIDKDYVIVTWMKDVSDRSDAAPQGGTGSAEILSDSLLSRLDFVKFNNLVSNRTYYVRAKTILTASLENGVVTKNYYYLVQISDSADFIDVVEIYVPSEPATSDSTRYYRRKDSDWCSYVPVITDMSGDDYDSEFNVDLVPLPETDFEIIYDSKTQTLTYRFRSNEKDEDDNNDNRVDQRLISRLVAKKTYSYNIDVTSYDNKTIAKRVIELPYTILDAFSERKITFKAKADNLTLSLSPGFMDTDQVKAIASYGDGSKLRITIEENPEGLPSVTEFGSGITRSYVSVPQQVSMVLITPDRSLNMTYLGAPLNARMHLDARYDIYDKNIGGYYVNNMTGGWTNANSVYKKENGAVIFDTKELATYAAIATDSPQIVIYDDTTTSMLSVTSKMTITDMATYNSNMPVTATNFNNVMYALLKGSKTAAINGQLSSAQLDELSKSGLLPAVTGTSPVPREQAVNSIVRAYEIKTKYKVTGIPTVNTTPYTDIITASTNYQQSLIKGGVLGFYGVTTNLSRPKANLNLGELFEMVNIVIQDSGM